MNFPLKFGIIIILMLGSDSYRNKKIREESFPVKNYYTPCTWRRNACSSSVVDYLYQSLRNLDRYYLVSFIRYN